MALWLPGCVEAQRWATMHTVAGSNPGFNFTVVFAAGRNGLTVKNATLSPYFLVDAFDLKALTMPGRITLKRRGSPYSGSTPAAFKTLPNSGMSVLMRSITPSGVVCAVNTPSDL
jgi:hypothetical protein